MISTQTTTPQAIAIASDRMLSVRDKIQEYESTLLRCAEHPHDARRAELAALCLQDLLLNLLLELASIAAAVKRP